MYTSTMEPTSITKSPVIMAYEYSLESTLVT